MTRVTVAKLVLAVCGIGLFFWANRSGDQVVRWVAIGLVAAAWLLRFAERGRRTPNRQGPSM